MTEWASGDLAVSFAHPSFFGFIQNTHHSLMMLLDRLVSVLSLVAIAQAAAVGQLPLIARETIEEAGQPSSTSDPSALPS